MEPVYFYMKLHALFDSSFLLHQQAFINETRIVKRGNLYCVLNVVCLQVKGVKKFTRSVCEVARSVGCGGPMAERRTVFGDSDEEINFKNM